MNHKPYGIELILDLHKCDPKTFTRESIKEYFIKLCKKIHMRREKLVWWDDLYTPKKYKETLPHLVGTSAIQFIRTSNITIHTLDIMKQAYINIFSCKKFNPKTAEIFTKKWFKGSIVNSKTTIRK